MLATLLAGGGCSLTGEGRGPACGQQPAPPNNAFYCPAGDLIACDESSLMIPYYVRGGNIVASFVLARARVRAAPHLDNDFSTSLD